MYGKHCAKGYFRKIYRYMIIGNIFDCSFFNQTKSNLNIMRDYATNISLSKQFPKRLTLINESSSVKCTFGCDVL